MRQDSQRSAALQNRDTALHCHTASVEEHAQALHGMVGTLRTESDCDHSLAAAVHNLAVVAHRHCMKSVEPRTLPEKTHSDHGMDFAYAVVKMDVHVVDSVGACRHYPHVWFPDKMLVVLDPYTFQSDRSKSIHSCYANVRQCCS